MSAYYTAIVVMTSFMLLVMIIGTWNNFLVARKRLLCFHGIFLILIILNWAEWGSVILRGSGNSNLVSLHYMIRFVEFVLTPCVPVLATYIFGRPKKIVFLPIIINVILQIIALFTPIVYTIDPMTNSYSRAPGYSLYICLFSIPSIVMFVCCIKFSRRYQHRNFLLLLLIMVSTLSALAISIMFSQLKLDWSIVSLTSVLFYVYILQMILQTDSQTKLLNRQSYEYTKSILNHPSTIVLFDIDYFKKLNDSFGHSHGDLCLQVVSECIKRVFMGKAFCYRYGGDEIVVISKKPLVNTKELIDRVNLEIEKTDFNNIEPPTVSAGFSEFVPGNCSLQDAINIADDMLYSEKEIKHSGK